MLTKYIVWTTVITLVGYDIFAQLSGWQTISAVVRDIDKETGGLFRWFWLALWLHFFIKSPWGGWQN